MPGPNKDRRSATGIRYGLGEPLMSGNFIGSMDGDDASAFDRLPGIPDDLVLSNSNPAVFDPFEEEPFEPEEDGEGDWDGDTDEGF